MSYQLLPPLLVVQLVPVSEVEIIINDLDLTTLIQNDLQDVVYIYNLYAVCLYEQNHGDGHYVCITQSPTLQKWILYQSQCVTILDSFSSHKQYTSAKPYLLFYRRRDISWSPFIVQSQGSSVGQDNSDSSRPPNRTPLQLNTVSNPVASPFHNRVLVDSEFRMQTNSSTTPVTSTQSSPLRCKLPPTVQCPYCHRFQSLSHLKRHMRTHAYACSHCSRTFSSEQSLQMHISSHFTTEYRCPHDGFTTKSFTLFCQHNRRQHQQNRYRCIHCRRKFKRSDHLRSHLIHKHKLIGPCQLDLYLIDSSDGMSTGKVSNESTNDISASSSSSIIKRLPENALPFPPVSAIPSVDPEPTGPEFLSNPSFKF